MEDYSSSEVLGPPLTKEPMDVDPSQKLDFPGEYVDNEFQVVQHQM